MPTMLYQQQQKAKQRKAKKGSSRRSSRSSSSAIFDVASKDSSTLKSRASLTDSEEIPPPEDTNYKQNYTPSRSRHKMMQPVSPAGSVLRVDNVKPGDVPPTSSAPVSLKTWKSSMALKEIAMDDTRTGKKLSTSEIDTYEKTGNLNSLSHVTEFKPFLSLGVLNNEKDIRSTFFRPYFVFLRFSSYLETLCEHQVSDPINFAGVRVHSLYNFVNRQKLSLQNEAENTLYPIRSDVHHYEGLISYELLRCRAFLRKLVLSNTDNKNCNPPEELIQSNIINYLEFLLLLPSKSSVSVNEGDDITIQHYKFKEFFTEISSKLNSLRKDGYLDEISADALNEDTLLQCIVKISHEFNLLENYHIHILVKLSQGFLVDHRLTRHLFSLHKLNLKLEKKESLKVMVFNTNFSRQYSWYLAVTLPFLRVFEMSVFNEEPVQGTVDTKLDTPLSSNRSNLGEDDEFLWNEYFSKINLGTFEEFSNMTRKELATIQKESPCALYPLISTHSTRTEKFQPVNFQYYPKSLSSIASETFHIIQSRDLSFQLNLHNYKAIFREFYRLLKPGGVLEMLLFRSGEEGNKSIPQGSKTSFPNASTFMGLEIMNRLHLIPHLLETMLQELSELFGARNVKFASSLLSNHLNMNNYLINYTALSVYEMFGQADQLCEQFDGVNGFEKPTHSLCHYFFYIKAEKS